MSAPSIHERRWLHDGQVAHDIRRTDWDRHVAWCGFTFLPHPRFQPLTSGSDPCQRCFRAREEAKRDG